MERARSDREGRKKNLFGRLIFILLLFTFTSFISSSVQAVSAQSEIDYDSIKQDIAYTHPTENDEEWHSERIEMIIIVRDQEQAALQPLAEWKTQKGVPTKIVNSSEYLTYSGVDTQEKIRNCIRDYYLNYSIQWVLLAGDTDLIPIRYTYNPDTLIIDRESEPAGGQEYKPTDFYYAELTGNWDIDGDGKFGESGRYSDADEIDWITEVYVGRFPGENSAELSNMVNKTIFYEKEQYNGSWMNDILMAGVVQTGSSDEDPDGEEEGYLVNKIIEESVKNRMDITKLIETNHPEPGYYTNISQPAMDYYVDKGNSIVYYAGHGSMTTFTSMYDTVYSSSNAITSTNYEMPSLFYADACLTGFIDKGYSGGVSGEPIGEDLMERTRGGAIGFIGAARLSWFYPTTDYEFVTDLGELCALNRGMSRWFFIEMFNNGNYQQGKALYEMKQAYLNSDWLTKNIYTYEKVLELPYNIHYVEWERKNVLTYNLLGDPEVDIYTDELKDFSLSHNFDEVGGYYEGGKITLIIRDQYNNIVKNARIALIGEDGAYNYFIPDSTGKVEFRLPQGVQEYNYTITGHNMNATFGSFEVKEDTNPPYFDSEEVIFSPKNPTIDDRIFAMINASDSETGVANGYLVLSSDEFDTYTIVELDEFDEPNCHSGYIEKMDVGDFSYVAFIFDYGGNANHTIWNGSDIFTVPIPLIWIFTFGSTAILIWGISQFTIKNKNIPEKYERFLGELI